MRYESLFFSVRVHAGIETAAASAASTTKPASQSSGCCLVGSCCPTAPSGLGQKALRVYRRRWAIETVFHVWALDRSRPRPQTIHAHVIQFSCHVLANTLGACAAFMIKFGSRNTDHGADVTFVSVTQVLVEIACDPG